MGRHKNRERVATAATAKVGAKTSAPVPTPPIGYTKVVTAPKRTEVTTKYKPKLVLTDAFVKKVDYLHEQVDMGLEWSAILLYTTKEGSADDANNWVIEVQDLILKDIGTPGYTEYDMTADDPSNDIWMDHLEAGGKMGHLHTHHNMTCYFSGTDTGELHDNAPQHNYYLSLIVNYKDPSHWCAKVAICGTETTAGTMTTTKSWKGAKGPMTAKEEETLDVTKEMLYLMECTLVTESSYIAPEGLQERIDYIKAQKAAKKAAAAYAKPYSYQGGTYVAPRNPWSPGQSVAPKTPSTYSAGVVSMGNGSFQRHASTPTYTAPGRLFADDDMNDGLWGELFDSKGDPIKPLSTTKAGLTDEPKYSPKICGPLLAKVLECDIASRNTLEGCIMLLEQLDDASLDVFMDDCGFVFRHIVELNFPEELDEISMHAIVVSMYAALEPYSRFNAFDAIDSMLAEYLMMEGDFAPTVIKKLTGIAVEDQVMLEKEELETIIEHED